ncbi:MAG: ribulose-phosphate 3-epimerase [Acidobacteria bacterium]|nr:MAG: ribulose-phosphate 3-epimerase [Acidobacteriota bacterium]REK01299.1 MAG: ribulose-phosphate 3-epimerase [Acidobacteriota bacterium]REK14255.1 MAG: ribulose-phosphate 3-epimerase [Acidobacteriota bacterium]REK44970.1 MAG: ribulose-phosphate 3-epimerase [Acidobacteriota bacterium]
MFELAPSLLSADFTRLKEDIEAVREGGATVLHVDVMDGHFVPNITIGLPVVKSLRKATDMVIDCHLMISEPDRYAVQFVKAGADMVSVHVEADVHLQRTLTAIREEGARAGVAINPGTPVSALEEVLPFADFILLMSVNPGFGGQSFIETSYAKLKKLRSAIEEQGLSTRIEIDGGIDATNVAKVVEAGAEIVVAGSAVYGDGTPTASAREMIEAATVWV